MQKNEKGERKMYKKLLIISLALFALMPLVISPKIAFAAVTNPTEIVADTIPGGGYYTMDPANCYDTASAELLFNVYETLIFFDGERYDYFIPQLATQVWVGPPDPAAPAYTNYTIYFQIRVGVPFHTWSRSDLGDYHWSQYYLTTADVEHSLERWMVNDYIGGPQWMIYESLLSCMGASPTPEFGTMIDKAIESNSTHVWLNVANKGRATGGSVSFAPVALFDATGRQRKTFWDETAALPIGYPLRVLFQVLSQSWASIMSKQWLLEVVDPMAEAAGHPVGEWPGTWDNWTLYHWPDSPLIDPVNDLPTIDSIPGGAANPGLTAGTGPYILQRADPGTEWSAVRYADYWRGWPLDWPNPPYPDSPLPPSGIKPKGYVERYTVRQAATSTRIAELQSGAADFAAIPRSRAGELHVGGDRYGPTLSGIRLNYPVFGLAVDSFHMTVDITPTTDNRYGKINDYDVLSADGIPRNFFSNLNVRKALAHLINFTMIVNDIYLTEGYQPYTVAPTGLPYVYADVPQYSYDETKAAQYLDAAYFGTTKLTSVGFTLTICYNSGNTNRQKIAEQVAASLNKVAGDHTWPFHATTAAPAWGEYLGAMDAHKLPVFIIGWLADYGDVHNFLTPYAHGVGGTFALAQNYNNATITALLDEAIYTPDGPARGALYHTAELMFAQDVPTVPLSVAWGRGYMRDWVQGMYYNPIYPGLYAANKWKWEMITTPGAEGYFVGDVDFDGRVKMDDAIQAVNSFGSYAGKNGMPTFHVRWNFRADVDDQPRYRWRDRKVDMGDIVAILANFGKTSVPWHT